jgi:hypothetical protein
VSRADFIRVYILAIIAMDAWYRPAISTGMFPGGV